MLSLRRTTSICVVLTFPAVLASFADEPQFAPRTTPQNLLDSLARPQFGLSRRSSSANPDLHKNGDAKTVGPGRTLDIADLEGPGEITHIWCTTGALDPFLGRSTVLRIYWDDEDRPSVESPLGDFFAVGHGAAASVQSLPVAVSSHGRSRNCFWTMPFRKRARITVSNDAEEFGGATFYYYVDWRKLERLPEDSPYFHARYRQEFPARPGDYRILKTTGRGHYVGTVLSVQHTRTGWFGEGDDRFYIDGETEPSIRGTGTEDYFGDAWGFRPYSAPMNGVSLWEGHFPGDRGTAYRWHLTDPVAFQESLEVSIEHKGSLFTDQGVQTASFEERPDWFSSVAFWYQTPPASSDEPLPPAKNRVAPYEVILPKQLSVKARPSVLLMKQDAGVVYIPRKPDARLEISFDAARPGRYRIAAVLMHSVFGSRYQPLLDGEPLGPERDLCHEGADPLWVDFDLHDLREGRHVLAFEGRGPSPARRTAAPAHFAIGVHMLVLLRLEDMEGYRVPPAAKDAPEPAN